MQFTCLDCSSSLSGEEQWQLSDWAGWQAGCDHLCQAHPRLWRAKPPVSTRHSSTKSECFDEPRSEHDPPAWHCMLGWHSAGRNSTVFASCHPFEAQPHAIDQATFCPVLTDTYCRYLSGCLLWRNPKVLNRHFWLPGHLCRNSCLWFLAPLKT